MSLDIRPLRADELGAADRIRRVAFGTYTKHPDPEHYGADAEIVPARFEADPETSLGALVDGELVGSNFAVCWGSWGYFGPLSVTPERWDAGIGGALVEATLPLLRARGCTQLGLLTFADSPKHIGLYQKHGFWPQHLTAVMARPVAAGVAAEWSTESVDPNRLTDELHPGLDLGRELRSVAKHGLGATVSLPGGDGFAVCHIGPGSEAGSGDAYIKFGMVRGGSGAARRLERLVDGVTAWAARHGASRVLAGMSLGREQAYRTMLALGFRVRYFGVAMQSPNEPGWCHRDAWVIDDWR